LCFYNTEQQQIQAPETIQVELQGKRSDLLLLDLRALAVHINAHLLTEPLQTITISKKNLFLPDSINLVHYVPSNVTIQTRQSVAVPKELTRDA